MGVQGGLFTASVDAAGATLKVLPVDPDTGALDLKSLQRIVTPLTRLLGVLTRITLGIAVVVGLQFACISLGLTFSCGVTTSDTVYC